MASKIKCPTKHTVKRHIVSIILVLIWCLLAAFEVALPFIIFRDSTQNMVLTQDGSVNLIYLYMCPVFIIPAGGILAIIVALLSTVAGIILHILAALLNIGAMIYFILFFKDREGMNLTDKMYQIVVPPLAMGLVAIMSLILSIDQCRHAYYNHKKKDEEKNTHYTALEGGVINDDSDPDSD